MDWSTKAMLQETLRCLQKTETDLGVNLDTVRKHVSAAIMEFDKTVGRCERCRGRGVCRCVLCGGVGELQYPKHQKCTRCLGTALEQCAECCGYGISRRSGPVADGRARYFSSRIQRGLTRESTLGRDVLT